MSDFTFELINSLSMRKLGELTRASNRTLQLGHDAAGSFSLSLPLVDPLSDLVQEISTAVLIKRLGKWLWSGPVWTVNESTPDTLQVGCIGWLQTLEKRVVKPIGVIDPSTGSGMWGSWQNLSYVDEDAGIIAQDLLGQSNGDSNFPETNLVIPGSVEPTQPRTRAYDPWTSVLQAITDLAQIESGYDILVDPQTRKMNIYRRVGRTRPEVLFEYGSNVVSSTRSCDASRTCNRMIAYSSIGFAVAEDLISQSNYGTFEEAVSLTGVVDVSILQAYVNAEIAIRSTPQRFSSFQPRQSSSFSSDPQIFRDFNISDTVTQRVRRGRLQVPSQQTRVFGATVNFLSNGQPQLASLQTTYTSV